MLAVRGSKRVVLSCNERTAMFHLLQLVSLSLVVGKALAVATWGQCKISDVVSPCLVLSNRPHYQAVAKDGAERRVFALHILHPTTDIPFPDNLCVLYLCRNRNAPNHSQQATPALLASRSTTTIRSKSPSLLLIHLSPFYLTLDFRCQPGTVVTTSATPTSTSPANPAPAASGLNAAFTSHSGKLFFVRILLL